MRFITNAEPLSYVIAFENKPTASAAAQDVYVTTKLDKTLVDFSTFSLGTISFGKNNVVTPLPNIIPQAGVSEYATEVDLRPATNLIVQIHASLDTDTGELKWRFNSIDPDTGFPPEDPTLGFLPPNVNSPEGEGSVSFTIYPKKNLPTSTVIKAQASIIFDTNAAILTPEWFNTIDNDKPSSKVETLNPTQSTAKFTVTLSGQDVGAGIGSVTVYVSDNGGPFVPTRTVSDPTFEFEGQFNHTYAFYSVARDNAGNVEPAKTAAEAVTTVTAAIDTLALKPTSISSGQTTKGTVTLTGPAPDSGAIIHLKSSDPKAVVVPDTVTVAAGKTKADFTATAGTVTSNTAVTITATYNDQPVTANLTIAAASTRISVFPIKGAVGETVYPIARLRNTSDGSPLSGRTLTFSLGTTTIGSATTDKEGLAQVDYTLPEGIGAGVKHLRVEFAGDTSHLGSVATGKLTVLKALTALSPFPRSGSIGATVTLLARLRRSSDNTFLANKTLNFKFGGTIIASATTGSDGLASASYAIPESMGVGTKSITIAFDGDNDYNASGSTVTLTVAQASTTISTFPRSGRVGNKVTLLARLRRSTDNGAVVNRIITFAVDGKVVGTATTGADGLASLDYTIPAGTSTGKKTYTASFAGDDLYKASTGTGTLTINP